MLNVPKRGLGDTLQKQLESEHVTALAALASSQQQEQGQQDADARTVSLISIAERLLREGQIGARHAKSLRVFLDTVKQLSWAIKGADPAEAVLAVLQQVPNLREFIAERHMKARKKAEGEAVTEQAESSGDEADTTQGKGRLQQHQDPSTGPAAAAAGCAERGRGTAHTAATEGGDDDDDAGVADEADSDDEGDGDVPVIRPGVPEQVSREDPDG